MAHDSNGKYIGFGVGDADDPTLARAAANWEAVSLINEKLHDKYSWARNIGVTTPNATYNEATADAIGEFCQRVAITPVLDVAGNAVATLAMRARLGSYPPPPPPTHAMLSVRGTGGIIGQDYTSQIPAALPGIYHEVPMDYPATMGGLPVGVAGGGPSGDDAADVAEQLLTDWVLNNTGTFAVDGYSLGTRGVIQFLNKLFDPTTALYPHRNRLVCVVLVADPWRPFGKSFYLGPVCSGQGIGAPYFTMSAAAQEGLGWRCCWLAQESDMYTNSPLGAVGQILADVEQIILGLSMSDPLGTMSLLVTYLWQIVSKDGGLQSVLGLPAGTTTNEPGGQTTTDPLGGLLGGIINGNTLLTIPIAGLLIALVEGLIAGIGGFGTNVEPGVEADTEAAILALKFFGGGIQGHLTYHVNPWSGNSPQTFLQLGIQHAADWAARVPVVL